MVKMVKPSWGGQGTQAKGGWGKGNKGGWGGGGGYGGGKGGGAMWVPDDVLAAQQLVNELQAGLAMSGYGALAGGGWGGGKGGKSFSDWGAKGGSKGGAAKSVGKKQQQKAAPAKYIKKSAGAPINQAWKSRLVIAYCGKYKQAAGEPSCIFQAVSEDEGNFIYSVSAEKFSNEYTSDPQENKKNAQEHAAMLALEAEFPEIWKTVPKNAKAAGIEVEKALAHLPNSHNPTPQFKKAKTESTPKVAAGGSYVNSKGDLMTGVHIMCGRVLTKDDIVFTCEEIGGKTVCTVELTCPEAPQSHKGKPIPGTSKDSKKQAETSAAAAALLVLNDTIEELKPAHEAQKAERKAAYEEKKAALLASQTPEQIAAHEAEKKKKQAAKAKAKK